MFPKSNNYQKIHFFQDCKIIKNAYSKTMVEFFKVSVDFVHLELVVFLKIYFYYDYEIKCFSDNIFNIVFRQLTSNIFVKSQFLMFFYV